MKFDNDIPRSMGNYPSAGGENSPAPRFDPPEVGRHFSSRWLAAPSLVEKPVVTLILLALVGVITGVGGWFLLTQTDFGVVLETSASPLQTLSTLPNSPTNQLPRIDATALVAGSDDDFYVGYEDKIVAHRLRPTPNGIEIASVWERACEKPVTALALLPGESRTKTLLVAFADRIERFDPTDSTTPGELFARLEADSYVTGLAVGSLSQSDGDSREAESDGAEPNDAELNSPESHGENIVVFAADFGRRLVHRFDSTGETLGRMGEPDDSSDAADDTPAQASRISEPGGFVRFQLGATPFFDLDWSPLTQTLYVANPGAFRVEAFTGFGEWLPNQSWDNRPGTPHGFEGCCNPAVVKVLPNGAVLTVEKGTKPRLLIFPPDGTLLFEMVRASNAPPLDGTKTIHAAVGSSEGGKNHLLLLDPTGNLDVILPSF